jgi:Neurotransmitter-gated ion-channel ligand binding domain/Low-density lipoprotein receptor domain class A
MKANMDAGFTLCYHLFGGNFQKKTLKLNNNYTVWLEIRHSYSYILETREIKMAVTLFLQNKTYQMQDVARNFSKNWDKFCFLLDRRATIVIYKVNDHETEKLSDIQVESTDMILVEVPSMFSQVTITSLNSSIYQSSNEGDICNWNASLWTYDKKYLTNITNINLISPLTMFIPMKLEAFDAYFTCRRIGNGTLADFQNKTEWKDLYNFYKAYYPDLDFVHFPYRQIDNNTIVNSFSKVNITNSNMFTSCQNRQKDSFFVLNDTACYANYMYSNKAFYFFCNFSSFPISKLTGLSNSTLLDKFYYPNLQLKKSSWLGFNGTSITYDQVSWRGKTRNSSVCIGSDTTEKRLLLGRNVWGIKYINSTKEDVHYLNLSMHPCQKKEYVCNDGSCTTDEKRCDGTCDCIDDSDEVDCKFILFPDDYNQEVIAPMWGTQKVHLQLDLHLQEVLDIKINDGKINLKLNVTATWLDPRLNFIYLNPDIRLNILSSTEYDSVWKPKFIYENKDTSPHFVNIKPEISISKEQSMSNLLYSFDNIYKTTTAKFTGELNPLQWSSVIRSTKIISCKPK